MRKGRQTTFDFFVIFNLFFMSQEKEKTTHAGKQEPAASVVELSLINPHAAGIEIGDREHVVAVPVEAAEERIRTFGNMTCDLLKIVAFLKHCNIKTVAM